jgi:hypothetical protein
MLLRWGRRDRLRRAAYELQREIVTNPGHGAWTAAWAQPRDRPERTEGAALRVIVGPVLSRVGHLDRAILSVLQVEPPQTLTTVLHQAHDALQPLSEIGMVWAALLQSRGDDSGSDEDQRLRAEMDLDFGGFHLTEWDHEEEAVSRVLGLMPLLDRVHQTLVPYSGRDLTTRPGL